MSNHGFASLRFEYHQFLAVSRYDFQQDTGFGVRERPGLDGFPQYYLPALGKNGKEINDGDYLVLNPWSLKIQIISETRFEKTFQV